MSSTPSRDTVDVILDGAMRALARHGTTRLSMTDICREAGVSRGTLYRYFASRDEVLTAVSLKVTALSRETFAKAVADEPALERRIQVILHAMLDYPNGFPHMRMMFEYEPRLSLDFLTQEMPSVIANLATHLEPALEQLAAGRAGVLTAEDLAELLYRIVTSSFLIPTTTAEEIEEKVARILEFSLDKDVEQARTASSVSN